MMSYTLAVQKWKKNGKFDIEGMCKLCKELRIDAVDMVTSYGFSPKEIRKIIDDYGIKCIAYTAFADLDFPSASERIKGVDDVKKMIDFAVELGAPTIMIPTPGKNTPRDISRKNWIKGLQESSVLARTANIDISIENFPGENSPFAISSDLLEATREVPDLKITFDSGNAFVGGEDPAISFIRSKDYVVHSHFKDWILSPEKGRMMMDGKKYLPALIGDTKAISIWNMNPETYPLQKH